MVHVGGAERIVKHLGPESFQTGLAHDSFVLFSLFGVHFSPPSSTSATC